MKAILISYLLLIFSSHSYASINDRDIFDVPIDAENTDLWLITAGLGDGLHTRYGHTIIEVRERHSVQYLNWGVFDFHSPDFISKFLRGDLLYKLGITRSYRNLVYLYGTHEKRRLVRQQIYFNKEEKERFFQLVYQNSLPENRWFDYEYFDQNCSTKPRDHIDQILNGQIKQRFMDQKTELTYRDYVMMNLNRPWVVGWALDIVMNRKIDRIITQYEETFYPIKLREYLESLEKADSPTGRLLGPAEVIVEGAEFPSSPISGHLVILPLFLILFLTLFWQTEKKIRYRLMGGSWFVIALISGVYGLAISFFHTLSLQEDVRANAKFFTYQAWSLFLCYPALRMLLTGRHQSYLANMKIWTWLLRLSILSHLLYWPLDGFYLDQVFFFWTLPSLLVLIKISYIYDKNCFLWKLGKRYS